MSTERITSSSYLNNNIRYIHNNLFDGNLNTAWAEGASGDGIGEWVKIEFENIKHINSIGIYNGYIKSQELYKANNRVKDIEVSFDNNRKIIITLNDINEIQWLTVGAEVKYLNFKILSIYKGEKYNDTVLSEIVFFDKEIFNRITEAINKFQLNEIKIDDIYAMASLDGNLGWMMFDYLSLENSPKSVDLLIRIYCYNEDIYEQEKKYNTFVAESCIETIGEKILNYPEDVIPFIYPKNSKANELILEAYDNLKANYLDESDGMILIKKYLQKVE